MAVSTLVFHHLAPDTNVRALADVRRVLGPRGRLIIAVVIVFVVLHLTGVVGAGSH